MMRVLQTTIAMLTMIALAQPARAQTDREDQDRAARVRDLAEQLRQAAAALERPQRFRVVLIVSSTMAEPPVDNIPADARKALEDMKAFLPFKSYRLFGTGEVEARRGQPATFRISGGDDQTFEIVIARDTGSSLVNAVSPRPNPPDPRLSLAFALRDVSGISPSRTLVVSQQLISTLVAMDVGETIVVGTSRVSGRGMLALLTALPNQEK